MNEFLFSCHIIKNDPSHVGLQQVPTETNHFSNITTRTYAADLQHIQCVA